MVVVLPFVWSREKHHDPWVRSGVGMAKMVAKILPSSLSLFLQHRGIQCMYNYMEWQAVALGLVNGALQELGFGRCK